MTKKKCLSHLFDWVLFVYFQDLFRIILYEYVLGHIYAEIQKILQGSQTFKQNCISLIYCKTINTLSYVGFQNIAYSSIKLYHQCIDYIESIRGM